MHKFGDVVQYQMGKVTVNALVVQSNPQPDGEHLVVVYLDPALQSNSMAGSLVDKAVAKAFPAPLSGSLAYGWKDLAPAFDSKVAAKILNPDMPSTSDLDAAAEQTKAKEATSTIKSTSSFSAAPVVHPENTVHQ